MAELAAKEGQMGFGIQSTTMVEAKGYSAHDGAGISLARLGGMKCGIITKRISETVALRARDLKLEFVYQGMRLQDAGRARDHGKGGRDAWTRSPSWATT